MIFQYASIKSIRDYGINSAQMSDSLALQLILKYSPMINRWTEQFFIPLASIERVNGGREIYRFPNKKIININSINLVNYDLSRTLLDAFNYEVIGNLIKLNFLTPEAVKNLEIDGIFGTIENEKNANIVLTSSIIKDSISFTVEDASELEDRDVIVYGNYCIIINSINYTTNTIYIDKFVYNTSILSGTILKSYGAVPILIEKAIHLLLKHSKTLENQTGGRIKSEKTDDYSYELFENKGTSSGITEVDNILNSFIEGNFDIMYL